MADFANATLTTFNGGSMTRPNHGNPLKVRFEWIGRNDANVSRRSEKYWEAVQVGEGMVLTRWGRVGVVQGTKLRTMSDFLAVAAKKLRGNNRGRYRDCGVTGLVTSRG